MGKRVTVTGETPKGLNTGFRDNYKGRQMSRPEFVGRIEKGEYPKYHVREIDGRKVPCSNPDSSERNNLG